MNKWSIIILSFYLALCFQTAGATKGKAESSWVYFKDSSLVYRPTLRGDRIVDFSYAGYMGGGVQLPNVKVAKTVKYIQGVSDYTDIIQNAIDEVSAMSVNEGFRGAVLLEPGEYRCSRSLVIGADGVVVRGSGDPTNKLSTIVMFGDRHAAFTLDKSTKRSNRISFKNGMKVLDQYVPCGSLSVHVSEINQFKAGDEVMICKPVTKQWLAFMRMNDLWRNGKQQTWIAEGSWLTTRRTIKESIHDQLTFTVPLVDSYDAVYTNDSTMLVPATEEDWVKQSGLENLRIVAPAQSVNHTASKYFGVRMHGKDCWLRDLDLLETMESVHTTGERITIRRVSIVRKAKHEGSSKPAEFAPDGGQILMDQCQVTGDNIWSVGIGAKVSGPIVLLNCRFYGDGRFQGHQRWSTAFLLDNCIFDKGGIDFMNRGEMGSGHGWGTSWSVAWNCTCKDFVNQQPPGCYNWVIGSFGKKELKRRPFSISGPFEEEGIYDSHGQNVTPRSLYLAQLKERLGQQALTNIGY